MPSDSGDRQLTSKPQNPGNTSSDHDSIPCPRCESTDTKFCYYNNYNLAQPRHFCKSCRRYWTQGGTLRNIPVGGGTRKNAKRSRTSPSTTTTSSCSSVSYPHHQNQETTTTHHHSDYLNNGVPAGKPISSYCTSDSIPVKSDTPLVPLRCDFNLNNVNVNVSGGGDCGGGVYTSLLNNTTTTQTTQETNGGGGGGGPSPPQQQPPPPHTGSGFLALGGFGAGFEDIGFDYKGFWAPLEGVATEAHGGGGGGGGATWLIGNGGGGNVGVGGAGDVVDGGYVDGGDHPYFAWPDLAISTTRKGLK